MIVRGKRPESNFTVVSNDIAQNHRLSYRARGVLVYILSRPDDWRTSADRLAKEGVEGRDAIRTALDELVLAGYACRVREQDDKGRWSTALMVFDFPLDTRGFSATDDGKTDDWKSDDWKSVVNISTDTKNLKQKNVANAPDNFSDEAKTSCALFCSLLERNGVPTPAKESKTYLSWLTEFDRLLRIGPPGANRGVSADDVKRVMLFAVNDEFWSSNVLSAKKLRQHFVRLQLQQRKVKGSGGIGTGGVA